MSLTGNDLMGLVGQTVKINRGGPDMVEGVLLAVQNNYLAIWAKDKHIVYVSTAHIKSVTGTGQSGGAQGGTSQSVGARSGGSRSGGVQSAMARPIQAHSFVGLLQSLQYRHVQINRGGPEKLEGIIINANQNYLMLAVKGEEVVRIQIFHIKSVTVLGSSSGNSSKGNKNNSNGNKNSSNGNKNSNQSGGNQSKGNQGGANSGGNPTRGNQTAGNLSRGSRTWGSMSWGSRSTSRTGNRTGNRTGSRTGNRKGNRRGNRRRNSSGE
ncbi:hypothetical protein [Paenibacillus chibensis]|uniref:hypothetical protein n=1 Tax=Paenibacillus chibensis TaxID=59846 RepID=UPI000FD97A5A|nr:hypothetical protein [Paenibacillus chibensis]MEC0371647.1 hypothetical protein [Paenibacillus chibensis]